MNIKAKLILGYGLVTALMIIPIFIAILAADRTEQSLVEMIDHERKVAAALEGMHVAGHEMLGTATEISLLKSLGELDANEKIMDEVQTFEESARDYHRNMNAFRKAISVAHEEVDVSVKQISAIGSEIIAYGNEQINAFDKRMAPVEMVEDKALLEAVEKRFETVMEAMLELEYAELEQQRMALHEEVENTKHWVLLVAGVILMLSLLFGVLHAASIVAPIDRLRNTADEIGAGNFVTPRDMGRKDEVGELAMAIGRMSEDLQSMTEKMARTERLSTLGQVAGTISHELRNPLGTIRTSVFNLRERLGDAAAPHERTLARIERNIVRCNKIIGSLLDFVRQRELKREATKLDAWLREALGELEVPAPVEVDLKLNSSAEVLVDQERLRRAVINVYDNACQAMMDEGCGGDHKDGCLLTISSRVAGDRVEIEFKDAGPGISEDELGKLFEPLYSTKSFGVGLGLPTVLQIMEQHGGGVDVTSVQGDGSRVVLWLGVGSSSKA